MCHVLHCEACNFPNPTAEEMIFTLVQQMDLGAIKTDKGG